MAGVADRADNRADDRADDIYKWIFTIDYKGEIVYKGDNNIYVLDEIVKMVEGKVSNMGVTIGRYKENGKLYIKSAIDTKKVRLSYVRQWSSYKGLALGCKEVYDERGCYCVNTIVLDDEKFSYQGELNDCIFLNDAFGLNRSLTKSAAKN